MYHTHYELPATIPIETYQLYTRIHTQSYVKYTSKLFGNCAWCVASKRIYSDCILMRTKRFRTRKNYGSSIEYYHWLSFNRTHPTGSQMILKLDVNRQVILIIGTIILCDSKCLFPWNLLWIWTPLKWYDTEKVNQTIAVSIYDVSFMFKLKLCIHHRTHLTNLFF